MWHEPTPVTEKFTTAWRECQCSAFTGRVPGGGGGGCVPLVGPGHVWTVTVAVTVTVAAGAVVAGTHPELAVEATACLHAQYRSVRRLQDDLEALTWLLHVAQCPHDTPAECLRHLQACTLWWLPDAMRGEVMERREHQVDVAGTGQCSSCEARRRGRKRDGPGAS